MGTPGLSSLSEEHWIVVVGYPVRQWLLLFQALADMIDFRAQDHSFSLRLQRLSYLGAQGDSKPSG